MGDTADLIQSSLTSAIKLIDPTGQSKPLDDLEVKVELVPANWFGFAK